MCDVNHDNNVILPWSELMQMSKSELFELYKEHKRNGQTVYFYSQVSGYWKLDHNADAVLIGKKI